MEAKAQKNLERLISQKALQMSGSFPCKMCALGFISGICITYLLLVAFSPSRNAEVVIFRSPSAAKNQRFSLMNDAVNRMQKLNFTTAETIKIGRLESNTLLNDDKRVQLLYSAWSSMLNDTDGKERYSYAGIIRSRIPQAPHLENCKATEEVNKQLDGCGVNGSVPPWTLWRGSLGLKLLRSTLPMLGLEEDSSTMKLKFGGNPPWVVGSDEDNYPFTRKVQKDIWIHQHPPNCKDPTLRFLVTEWERLPGFGIGAQLAGMAGLLAIAINEKRILVTDYYNRADHDGCQGSSRSQWSCYFFLETSQECREQAVDLMKTPDALTNGIVTMKSNYSSKHIWSGRPPRSWGEPWSYLQPTTDVDGSLLTHHRKMDRRWWRAQAIRYLMRFQSEYTCSLMNMARHEAFGLQAAKMVVGSLPETWPEVLVDRSQADMEQFVWSNHKPWIPKPLLSMHVRMGDKACEMKVVDFKSYMKLAERVRSHFPDLNSIWLSTEMQAVIDQTKLYPSWNFHYSKVVRQVGNITMATYEASLGRETSTNYPLVNFIMATEADFFVGALGSTWCFLIDGMRNTGGKVMAGYLSVNKDRFW